MSISVLHSTAEWLAVDKPAGWLTIPGRPVGLEPGESSTIPSPVLLEELEREHGKLWVVHRIDRETSGVVLFARSAEAHRRANAWFSQHETRKFYDFLAAGEPTVPMMRIKRDVEGASSLTQVEVVEQFAGAFLGRARLHTGRRHQIRVHLSAEGFPLLGDIRYGGKRVFAGARGDLLVGRVALHAKRLELPTGDRPTVIEAPWPEDFKAWVEKLRHG